MLLEEHKDSIQKQIEKDFKNTPINKDTLTAYLVGVRKKIVMFQCLAGCSLMSHLLDLFEQDFVVEMIMKIVEESRKK